MFSATCIGNLTRDPDTKFLDSGMTITTFSVACRKNAEETDFFDFVAFKKQAELISKYCFKGSKVGIVCHPTQNRWTDADGNQRSKVSFIVDMIEFLGKPVIKEEVIADNPIVTESIKHEEPAVPF